jgi:amino acid transporter
MKNSKLRLAWIIPNAFCYIMFAGFSVFTVLNAKSLQEVNRLSIWVLAMLILLFVSIMGSYRIRTWVKEGKM